MPRVEESLHLHLHCLQSQKHRRSVRRKAPCANRSKLSQSTERVSPIAYVVAVCNVDTLLDETESLADVALQIISCGLKKLPIFIPDNNIHSNVCEALRSCYRITLYRRVRT